MNLRKRTWFNRVWTFQEAVACKHTILQIVSERATLEVFREIVAVVHTHFQRTVIWKTDPAFMSRISDTVQALEETLERREALQQSTISRTCSHLLVSPVRGRNCTDNRDKVFSILGLLNLQEPEKWRVGFAQYGRPVEHIFMDFAVDVMQRDQNLDVFSRCCLENWKYKNITFLLGLRIGLLGNVIVHASISAPNYA